MITSRDDRRIVTLKASKPLTVSPLASPFRVLDACFPFGSDRRPGGGGIRESNEQHLS